MGKVSAVVKKMEKKIDRWPRFMDRFGILEKGITDVYARGKDESMNTSSIYHHPRSD